MNRHLFITVLTLAVLGVGPAAYLQADGGTVRLAERHGAYQITVFTAPIPFRAGPVDVSVLVQNGATKELVPEVQVSVKATRLDHAGPDLVQPATADAATNKLFQAAVFDLPAPGWYSIEVAIEGPLGEAHVRFDVEAGERQPRVVDLWLWIGWPIIPIVLFGLHQVLVLRRQTGTGLGSACRFP